ncbi:MAG: T9SS type A sorting domain-containing protein [Candidatus Cloacimonadales bacterium]|nr:T9SS type A sorting domain-containing protein [Candidatus Cloacimonadales bacterium]
MKKLIILCTLMILISLAWAQLQWDYSLPVRQGVNIEWSRASEPMSDGSVIYVWSDTRNSDRDLWAQRVDDEGNLLWGDEGKLVNGQTNRQEDPVIIGDGNGNVIIAWVDFRYEDAGDIFAQKLDGNGNRLWANAGVALCTATEIQISLNIVNDTNGGAYIIWQDSRNAGGSDIYGTHILSGGTIASGWDADGNGITTASGDQDGHTFWEDGTGGAILAWHDTRNPDDENIYMQRIASNGDLVWNANGVLLIGANGKQEQPKMCPDGTGNFIFSWRDWRNDLFGGDIFAQRVDLNGNLLWSPEVQVCVRPGEVQRNARLQESSDTGAFVVWEDGRNEVSDDHKDIYAQKLSTSGTLLWNAAGVPVVIAENNQINPRLEKDANGGCWIVWEDGRIENHPYGDIYVQHLNSSGAIQLETNGKIICDAAEYQFSPLTKLSNGDIFLVWGDKRTGSTGIYVQLLDSAGNTQLPDNGQLIWYGLDGDALNYQLMANGANQVIVWEDTRNASIAIQIFLQVVYNDETFGFVENGVAITSPTGYTQQNIDAYLEQGTDLVTTVWQENRTELPKVYAQGFNINNSSMWENLGVSLCAVDIEQHDAKISYDNGSYYTGWTDYNGEWMNPIIKVSGQKLDAAGNLLWGANGVEIADQPGDDNLTDVVGRYYIWQNENWPTYKIYAKLVDENGNTAAGWEDDGKLICNSPGTQTGAKGIMTPEGLLIVWKTVPPAPDSLGFSSEIYGQLVAEDGTALWAENGIPLVSFVNDQIVSNFLWNDAIYMVWEDYRTGTNYDVFMQKYDEFGAELWQTNGLPIITNNFSQQTPYLVENNDLYMVFWSDKESETESKLMGQYINSSGNLIWPSNGLLIDDGIKNQNKPVAVTDNSNAYVFWEDTRSSGKTDIYNIYAQKVFYGIPPGVGDDDIPQEFNMLRQNYPNPFKTSTTISFNINPNLLQDGKVSIFNIRGQHIKTIEVDNSTIQWDGKDLSGKEVANGIYFYKLKAKGVESKPKKMILLK